MKDEMLPKRYQHNRQIALTVTAGIGAVVALCYAYVQNHIELVLKTSWMMGMWAAIGITLALFFTGALTAWALCRIFLRCPACRKYAGIDHPNYCPKCATPLR